MRHSCAQPLPALAPSEQASWLASSGAQEVLARFAFRPYNSSRGCCHRRAGMCVRARAWTAEVDPSPCSLVLAADAHAAHSSPSCATPKRKGQAGHPLLLVDVRDVALLRALHDDLLRVRVRACACDCVCLRACVAAAVATLAGTHACGKDGAGGCVRARRPSPHAHQQQDRRVCVRACVRACEQGGARAEPRAPYEGQRRLETLMRFRPALPSPQQQQLLPLQLQLLLPPPPGTTHRDAVGVLLLDAPGLLPPLVCVRALLPRGCCVGGGRRACMHSCMLRAMLEEERRQHAARARTYAHAHARARPHLVGARP